MVRIRFDDFVLDTMTRQLRRSDRAVSLSPKAFELLQTLAEQRPRALSKKELVEALWPNVFVAEENLKARIAEIRRALGDGGERRYIRTIQRFGYAFEAAARNENTAALSDWLVESAHGQFNLIQGENIVGRDLHARVRIDASSVSRRHARIVITSDQATLEDLGSKNGTRLGEDRVQQPTVLNSGDRIQFGAVLVRIRNSAALPSTDSIASDAS